MEDASVQKPVTVPEAFRKKPPAAPATVSDMQIGETRFVEVAALRVDQSWGMWIDPSAVAKIMKSGALDQPAPIRVDRLADGYRVFLTYAVNTRRQTWDRTEGVTHFKGFIPVTSLG